MRVNHPGAAEAQKKPDDPLEGTPKLHGGPATPESEPGLPRMLTDRYRLERLIATGGMGRVYLASQLPLERRVALKHLVRPSLNEDFRRRFFLEASVLARLSHPNIVVVHDYGEATDGSLFMVMEYLDGLTLLELLRREGRLLTPRALEIVIQVCRALKASHKQGVAHRDLKPGNIMVLRDVEADERGARRDVVKVLDFGLVKVFQEDAAERLERDLTHSEMMLGSPRYMAPEQIQCGAVDARADIYSIGVVFFAMLTGRPPFVGNTLEILNQHLEAEVPKLNTLTQQLKGFDAVPTEAEPMLNAIIHRCMEKSPDRRYQSMDELLIDLRTVYRQVAGEAPDPSSLDATHPALVPLPTTPTPSPAARGDDASEASHKRRRPDAVEAFGTAPVEPYAAAARPVRRHLLPLAVVATVVLILALVGGLALALRTGSPAPAATEPAAVTEAPEPAAPVAAEPQRTTVSITSTPAGARVLMSGELIGLTPTSRELERRGDGSEAIFDLELDGYQPVRVHAALDAETREVHADLVALPPPAEKPGSPRRGHRPRRGDTATGSIEAPPPVEPPAPPPQRGHTTPRDPDGLVVEEPRTAVPVVD